MKLFPPARPALALVALALAATAVTACDAESAGAEVAAASPARDVRDLIAALTPPPATAVPVVKSEYFSTRKRMLERLRVASEAHGLEALRVYREEKPTLPQVRAGLLDVAAHAAPEATQPLLEELTVKFGEDLYVRTEAALLLGQCTPLRAVEVLDPILRERYDDRTYPPEERLLEAWVYANEALELDPVPLLAEIATDIKRPMDVRHRATKELGKHRSPLGRDALKAVLVESTGNGYIRRLALQALQTSLPKDEFCKLAADTQANEADTDFIVYIQSHLDKHCR